MTYFGLLSWWSFFNIVKALIDSQVQATAANSNFILEQGYYHPFLLQSLCKIVFDFKRSSNTDRKEILKGFNIQTEELFDYLWEQSNPDKQEALKKLVSQDQDIPKPTMDKLDRRSLLTEVRDKIFCPTFEENSSKDLNKIPMHSPHTNLLLSVPVAEPLPANPQSLKSTPQYTPHTTNPTAPPAHAQTAPPIYQTTPPQHSTLH